MLPSLPMTVSAEPMPPFDVVKEFFTGLSTRDNAQIRSHLTADFHLLEHGEVWDTDRLMQAIQGDYTRRNFFRLLEHETHQDMTWVSYWNRATFSGEQMNREQLWLESAVLVREEGQWRIRMLHSTRVASDDEPAGLELEEHPHD